MVDKNEASWLGQLRRGVADRCVLALLEHRAYYALTPAGADALAQFRAQWTQFTRAVNELMDHAKEVSSE